MEYWAKQRLKEARRLWRRQKKRARRAEIKKNGPKKVMGNPLFSLQHDLCKRFMRDYNNKPTDVIIAKLIEISKLKFKNMKPYKERRKKGHYCDPKHKCFACKQHAEVQHHMIQIQHGGYDNGVNRIKLCNMCHARIHTWMMDEVLECKEMEMVREIKAFC